MVFEGQLDPALPADGRAHRVAVPFGGIHIALRGTEYAAAHRFQCVARRQAASQRIDVGTVSLVDGFGVVEQQLRIAEQRETVVGVCGRSRNDHLAAAELGHVISRPGRSVGVVVRSAPKGLDRRAVPVLPVVEDAGIETRIAVFIRILPVVGTLRIVDRLSGHRSVGIDHLLRRTGQTLAVGDAHREILDFDAVADFRRAGQNQLFVARDHREKLPVVGRSAGDHLLVPVRLRDGGGFVDVVIAQSDHFGCGRGCGLPAFLVVGAVTDEFVVAAVVALAVIERAGGIKQ